MSQNSPCDTYGCFNTAVQKGFCGPCIARMNDVNHPKMKQNEQQGIKHDQEKPMLALIPPEAEEEEAKVWQAGAKKYGLHNFRGGLSYLRILSALRRHTAAIIAGEDYDLETGCLHAAHVRCCAAMLIVFKDRRDLDDRFKSSP